MSELVQRLRTVRQAIAEGRPREARDLADRALADAAADPDLRVLAALAAADLGRPGAGEALAEALEAGRGELQDRVAGWVRVAEAADERRLWARADAAWKCAVAESGDRQDLLLGRAGALLRAGRTDDALPLLSQATAGPDTAVALASWLILSGVHLADYRLGPGEQAAEQALALAEQRHCWLAYAAAAIDLSEVRLRRQDKRAALDGLVAALQVCRGRGDPGGLLVARVHEVRSS